MRDVAACCSGELNVNGDNTLLITAAQNGLKRVAKLLLQKGADMNARVRCVCGSLVLWTLLSC
jgi:ankyrin repeat protein